MLTYKKCVLYVYKEQLGLPSIDYRCLQALFLVEMQGNRNIEIKSSGFYTTPNFPMLECDGQLYTSQDKILRELEKIAQSTNTKTNIRKSRIAAYKALTYQVFETCITMNFFCNEKNCQYLMKMYGSEKYFPMRLIYLRRMNNHVHDRTLLLKESFNEADMIALYGMLESYLTDISHLLTLNKFLLGNTPSTLDAFVCGYLVPIYTLNLPDKTLKSVIQRYDIVVKYMLNYLKYYNIKIIQEVSNAGVQEQDENDRASFGLLATAGFVALSLMFGYGIINDVFRLK